MPLYAYECKECGCYFDLFKPMDLRDEVYCCKKKASRVLVNQFYTDKDLAYQFDCNYLGDKPVHIRSKTHYKKLLKEYGLANCSPQECIREAEIKKKGIEKNNKKRIAKKSEQLAKTIMKDNVNHVAADAIQKMMKASSQRTKGGGNNGKR